MGQIIDPRSVPNSNRVLSVRVEAPEYVDDIVVTFSNGSRKFIQAKESLKFGSDPWVKFWTDIFHQYDSSSNINDRYALYIGNSSPDIEDLSEIIERRSGKESYVEWYNSINKKQKNFVKNLELKFSKEGIYLFKIFEKIEVVFNSRAQIESTGIRDYIPASSVRSETLFSVLRDLCGGAARVRARFSARSLLEALSLHHNITIIGNINEGLEKYLDAVKEKYSTLSVPGTSFGGSTNLLWIKPTITEASASEGRDFEEEDPFYFKRHISNFPQSRIELNLFPPEDTNRILIEAGAGFGKSTLIGSLAHKLATDKTYIPVVMLAGDISATSGLISFLSETINSLYNTKIAWLELLQQGRVVLFVDGLDELNDEAKLKSVNHIKQACALFPECCIVVTGRDGSSLNLVGVFKSYKINKLEHDDQITLLENCISLRNDLDKDTVVDRFIKSKDLVLLCKIPLFLSLLVATMPSSGVMPKSRAELLERYLSISMAPHRNQKNLRPALQLTRLRAGAEALALELLKRNEASVPELLAMQSLYNCLGPDLAETCIDELIRCGVLIRRGFKIGFAIATVQEYLAGCALCVDNINLSDAFANIARRPWAQAIQFAIERTNNIEQGLKNQIDVDDDIFHTSLLVIARSIIGGAKVSVDFKEIIIDRLLKIWGKNGYITEEKVDNIFLDGLAYPASQKLIQYLKNSTPRRVHASLLKVILNDDLTIAVLQHYLMQEDIRYLWMNDWIDALKPVSDRAVPILLAKAVQGDLMAGSVIATVLFRLREGATVSWESISKREDIRLSIKVSALWGASLENSSYGRELILRYIKEVDDDVDLWIDFHAAYFATNWWKDHMRSIIIGPTESNNERRKHYSMLVDAPVERPGDLDFVVEYIEYLFRSTPIKDNFLFGAMLLLASFGNEEVRGSINNNITNSEENIFDWISYLPHLNECDKVGGINAIRDSKKYEHLEYDILNYIFMVFHWLPSGARKNLRPRGPYITSNIRTASNDLVIDWAKDFIANKSNKKINIRSISSYLFANGYGKDYDIKNMIDLYMNEITEVDDENWAWIIRSVGVLRGRNFRFDPAYLTSLIMKCKNFPTYQFYSILIEQENENSLNIILDIFNKVPNQRGRISSVLSEVAPSKGITVKIKDGNLAMVWAKDII